MLQESRLNEMEYHLPSTSEEILGIFLKDPALFAGYKRKLTPSMFLSYAALYTAMLKLDDLNMLDYKTLAMEHPEFTKTAYELRQSVASTARLPFLVEQIKKDHLASELYSIARRVSGEVSTGERDPNELLNDLQQRVNGLSNTDTEGEIDPDSDVEKFYTWLDEIIEDPSKAYGMMTNLEEIDRITTGFHRGDFIVVGARTSIGKSAFQIEMALRLAKNGYKVAIFSLEMSRKQIYLRMLANLMTFPLEMLKTGRIVKTRIDELRSHKEFLKTIIIDDTRGISGDYITNQMRRIKRVQGLDVVMVDYLQDIKEQGETNDNSGSAIARVCRKLRKGAQECNCALFGISQVKREVEARKDKRPMTSDLSDSTGIETSADVIAMLYREDYYDPDTELKGVMEVNFAKQRNGSVGMVKLFYEKKCQQLRPLATGRY